VKSYIKEGSTGSYKPL